VHHAISPLFRKLDLREDVVIARATKLNTRDDLSSRQWLIVLVFAIAFSSIACLAGFIVRSRQPADNKSDTFANTKVGSILIEHADGKCERFKFDNVVGSIALDHRSCNQMVNGSGLPAPEGTSERLSAIRRAFSGE
jgi:hypothetical protein